MARESKAKKVYIYEDGTEGRSAKPEATALQFRFENGNVVEVKADQFPETILKCAAMHGIAQKVGDTYNDAKSIDDAQEECEKMIERLQDGIWVTEKKASGPRIGVLVEALARVLEAADRPADRVALANALKGDAAKQKYWKDQAPVAAMITKVEIENKQAKLKDLTKEAKSAETDLDAIAALA